MKHYVAPARAAFQPEMLARQISTKPLLRGALLHYSEWCMRCHAARCYAVMELAGDERRVASRIRSRPCRVRNRTGI